MTNKAKLVFLIVFVVTSLLIKSELEISKIELRDIVSTVIGGVVAILIISFLQKRKESKE